MFLNSKAAQEWQQQALPLAAAQAAQTAPAAQVAQVQGSRQQVLFGCLCCINIGREIHGDLYEPSLPISRMHSIKCAERLCIFQQHAERIQRILSRCPYAATSRRS